MSGIVEQPSQDAASAAALYGEIAEGWSLSDLDEDRPQKPARPAKAGEIVDGQIKWFDATRGFGFIVPMTARTTCCSRWPPCGALAMPRSGKIR